MHMHGLNSQLLQLQQNGNFITTKSSFLLFNVSLKESVTNWWTQMNHHSCPTGHRRFKCSQDNKGYRCNQSRVVQCFLNCCVTIVMLVSGTYIDQERPYDTETGQWILPSQYTFWKHSSAMGLTTEEMTALPAEYLVLILEYIFSEFDHALYCSVAHMIKLHCLRP